MQHPAVPELAHTTTRPVHWLATAAALAAVVAGAAFVRPGAATAAPTGTDRPASSAQAAATAPPDPADVRFPLNCGPADVIVQKKASGDLDGDGRPETVAVVRCDAGSGTPPNGVYVLARATGAKAAPRIVATLVDPKDRRGVDEFGVRRGVVSATLLGYSSADVPGCCPDVHDRAEWRWKDGSFVRSVPAGAQAV